MDRIIVGLALLLYAASIGPRRFVPFGDGIAVASGLLFIVSGIIHL